MDEFPSKRIEQVMRETESLTFVNLLDADPILAADAQRKFSEVYRQQFAALPDSEVPSLTIETAPGWIRLTTDGAEVTGTWDGSSDSVLWDVFEWAGNMADREKERRGRAATALRKANR